MKFGNRFRVLWNSYYIVDCYVRPREFSKARRHQTVDTNVTKLAWERHPGLMITALSNVANQSNSQLSTSVTMTHMCGASLVNRKYGILQAQGDQRISNTGQLNVILDEDPASVLCFQSVNEYHPNMKKNLEKFGTTVVPFLSEKTFRNFVT